MIVTVRDYSVVEGGVRVHLTTDDPRPYTQSDFYVYLADSEVPDNISQPTLTSLLQTKLNRAFSGTVDRSTMTSNGILPLNQQLGHQFTVSAQ